MFVDQELCDAGRPVLDTIAKWLDENGGVDAVLTMADGKEVRYPVTNDAHARLVTVDR